ncbi:hypothetical protein N7466_011531 [Penicillium verhagenii]|uniref:uncharacterized protein n=1 Tax=Penicillium verhagenii TaxID=1562060 RepID=UPI002545557A|nr:uncharacterized protein N7466_011531 [Penicillium verhagenii]KAJ5915598.1 hypothetical protein N7466_011531 [Penicillium verhagenii]
MKNVPKSPVRLEELKTELQPIVEAQPKTYKKQIAILFYWDDDEQSAKQDIQLMTNFLSTFGVNTSYFKLSSHPQSLVEKKLIEFVEEKISRQEARYPTQDLLLILNYVGHAFWDEKIKDLRLGPTYQTYVKWGTIHEAFFRKTQAPENTDVLGILDCCEAGSVARLKSPPTRATQVLAACGEHTDTNSQNGFSFSKRLFATGKILWDNGMRTITTADILQEINTHQIWRKHYPPAQLVTYLGRNPIASTFKDPKNSPSAPRSPNSSSTSSSGTFSAEVEARYTVRGELENVRQIFNRFNGNTPARLQVSPSHSCAKDGLVYLTLRMTWYKWAIWSMVVDIEFVREITTHSPSPEGSQRQTPPSGDKRSSRDMGSSGKSPRDKKR